MKRLEQMTPANIGRLVQAERKRQGLSQLQLAGMAIQAFIGLYLVPKYVD